MPPCPVSLTFGGGGLRAWARSTKTRALSLYSIGCGRDSPGCIRPGRPLGAGPVRHRHCQPRDPGVLAYITTYREPAGRFGYELELPPLPGDDSRYRVAGRGDGVSFEELAGVVSGQLIGAAGR